MKKNLLQNLVKDFLESYKAKNFAKAEKIALLITAEHSEHPYGWKALGELFKQTGKITESLRASQKVVELTPEDADAHNTLGNRFQELRRLDEAEKSYKKSIEIKPDSAIAQNNLANTLRELKRLNEAEKYHKKAIELNPNFSRAYYNLAITLKDSFKLIEAETNYKKAIDLDPNFAAAYNNLGNIQKHLDKTIDAEKNYLKAIAIKPKFAAAYNNLGNLLKGSDRIDESENNYKKAIKIKPDYLEAYLNLCELLEKTNRLDDVLITVNSAKKALLQKSSDIMFFEALIHFRQENFLSTEKLIEKIKDNNISNTRKANFFKFKAEWFQFKKNFDTAFGYFMSMNNFVKNSISYKKLNPEQFFNKTKEKLSQTIQLQKGKSYEKIVDENRSQPNFLIGFPRSGTTLIDTILRGHSKIKLIEEKPLIIKMLNKFDRTLKISEIEDLDSETTKIFSNTYFDELKQFDYIESDKLLIDKLPLNILNVALISKVFPNTKFILALRHPMDCILSCWMQNFEMNHATANMVDLQRIVDFYCTSMEILKVSKERYKLNIHRVRYEDLICNLKGEVSNILDFFSLDWQNNLEDYQKTANNRKMIRTPSYSQVIKPVFETASYRWKNYGKHLKQYEIQLKPWIEEFGY